MTGTASGSSSAAVVLNPVNPSVATTSMPVFHSFGATRSAHYTLIREESDTRVLLVTDVL